MRNLKAQILQEIEHKKSLKVSDLTERFGVSRQAINRHLKGLIDESKIRMLGSSKKTTFYIPNTPEAIGLVAGRPARIRRRMGAAGASEDEALSDVREGLPELRRIAENARSNFEYAFTEMVNNAIDHSETDSIDLEVSVDPLEAVFIVRDSGIGVFWNIMTKMGLASEMEAIEDLLKGKQTTAPDRHSGEGIFFTSKIVERFVLESHRKRLTVDNSIGDLFLEDIRQLRGTRVVCTIDASSRRSLPELFEEYTSEEFAFDRTRVSVKLFESGESYVSRAQAKRLVHSLERFREIVLDFSGVESVGQGFADEIFRVFQGAHPDIAIIPVNMGENVEFMVRRAI